ncbi:MULTISPECIES: hypothetical protein [Bacillaceae]|uniref:Uncharacterized protein n=1 Tax=Oceanobacillus caeni TaxID=405946 RepID=A0ABR5MJK0_9BACI|nr:MULTISPECIES: hypothetical protein [Bacillaceae]KPH75824.1 hypothetical protein AFL42_08245 [Oceanobacillus caeni]MED4473721.1 hypothetical protein [Oceanobacillus caeni]
MKSNLRLLSAAKIICGSLITIGTILFLYGFANGYSNVAGVGYGTVMGGVFIFIMSIFLVATEEMLKRKRSGI